MAEEKLTLAEMFARHPNLKHIKVTPGTQEEADSMGILIFSGGSSMESKQNTPEPNTPSAENPGGWTMEQFQKEE